MWTRCWWATWVSGFFGVAGLAHVARWMFRIPVRLGAYDVPVAVSLTVGLVFLAISAGLLWLEVRREQTKQRRTRESRMSMPAAAAEGGGATALRPVGIVTISDSRSQGTRADTTTALIRRLVEEAGYTVGQTAVVPDDAEQIEATLIAFADRHALSLVLTTGGTGVGPRDVTPEATRRVIQREVPGVPEAMRFATALQSPLAWLSRGIAGLRDRTLIVNLPGSPHAVEECLRVLIPLLPHALAMIAGAPHDPVAVVAHH